MAKTRSASFAVASGAAPCTRTFRPPMQRRPRPPARARRQTALTSGQRHYPRARRRRRRRLRPAPRWQCRRTSRGSSPGRSGKAALQSSGPPPAARPTTTSHPRCPRVLRPTRQDVVLWRLPKGGGCWYEAVALPLPDGWTTRNGGPVRQDPHLPRQRQHLELVRKPPASRRPHTHPFPDCLFETSPNSSDLVRSRRHFRNKHPKEFDDANNAAEV